MPFTLHAVSSNLIRASASTTYLRCTAASSPQASPHATAPSAHHAVEPFFFPLFGEKENRAALADGLARLPVRGLCLGICFIWAESSMWPSKFTEFAGLSLAAGRYTPRPTPSPPTSASPSPTRCGTTRWHEVHTFAGALLAYVLREDVQIFADQLYSCMLTCPG